VLAGELELVPCGPKQLEMQSEDDLSAWMRDHLTLAVHPFPDADALGDLERRVLARLDPPLNLDGMPPTSLRQRLAQLRRELERRCVAVAAAAPRGV